MTMMEGPLKVGLLMMNNFVDFNCDNGNYPGLSYFGCQCNDSDDADIAQYFKVLPTCFQYFRTL